MFNIQSQSLAAALGAWSKQTGMQVVWLGGGDVRASTSAALQGKYDPLHALHLLLRDFGLTFSIVNDHTVAIQDAAKQPSISTKDGDSALLAPHFSFSG